jgi:hypothetical protein
VVKDSRAQEDSWSKIRVLKKIRGQNKASFGLLLTKLALDSFWQSKLWTPFYGHFSISAQFLPTLVRCLGWGGFWRYVTCLMLVLMLNFFGLAWGFR